MIVVKKITKNNDGTYSSEWSLSEAQMNYLLTFSINTLLAHGLIDVQEEPSDKQQQLDFLENMHSADMGQA